MKVYIYLISGKETPGAATTLRGAAKNIGVQDGGVWKQFSKQGFYQGKAGKIWRIDVERCNRRMNKAQ